MNMIEIEKLAAEALEETAGNVFAISDADDVLREKMIDAGYDPCDFDVSGIIDSVA